MIAAVATLETARTAVLADATTAWEVGPKDCVGAERLKVIEIGASFVTLGSGATQIGLPLHPLP